jgi:hypothetical protein
MKTLFLFFTIFFFVGLLSLEAQDQAGSVAIADAIVPSAENVVGDFTDCVKELAGTAVPTKDAIKACKEVSKLAVRATTRVANEAADATKASRPMIVDGWGGNYGYSGYGYRYRSYRRPVVRQPCHCVQSRIVAS